MSRYDLHLWALDLESLWKIRWHVAVVCTKFDRNRTIPGRVIHNLANFCSCYVSLWPWPLTPWPWTFVVLRASCVKTLCKNWAKSNDLRQSYSRFSTFSPSNFWLGPNCMDRTAPNLQGTQSDHRWLKGLFQTSDILLRFQTRATQNWAMLKTMPNFALSDPLPL